ncbi:MAG: PD40 domain-containing protein, partial [Odoribacter sp.]|nr:PD40 domain-containing protein [Odoribacter sp.]
MTRFALITIIAMALTACEGNSYNVANDGTGYPIPNITLESDVMTPEVLWTFGRMGSIAISPDGKYAVYPVTYFDKAEDCSYSDLYIVPTDGSTEAKRLTNSSARKSEPAWTPDGEYITYMSGGQLWIIKPDGTSPKKISDIAGGIEGYKISPDGTKLLYIQQVKLEQDVHDMHPDLPKATGMLFEDQVYRHWDSWITTYTHPFVTAFNVNVETKAGKDIMEGEHWESPVRPHGGMEQLTWTNDSKGIA